jgi:hypothetical protein
MMKFKLNHAIQQMFTSFIYKVVGAFWVLGYTKMNKASFFFLNSLQTYSEAGNINYTTTKYK